MKYLDSFGENVKKEILNQSPSGIRYKVFLTSKDEATVCSPGYYWNEDIL